MTSHLSRPTATFIGFTAVLLWSLLAFLTAASGTMPAFQLTAITFAIGGLSLLVIRPGATRALRQPLPVWPAGLKTLGREGAGEVQTPLQGESACGLRVGDRVWFRHAKSGELAERVDAYRLVDGGRIVGEAPTYRGEGKAFL